MSLNSADSQLAELDSQRANVLAERERLREELTELTGKLFLINHREELLREQAVEPQSAVGS